jgi:hypothetical protein
MTVTMPCSACGFVVSATTAQLVSEAYWDHWAAVHATPSIGAREASPRLAMPLLVQTRG